MTNDVFRHEYKYTCSVIELALLRGRINSILKKDKNVGETGTYLIRSVYFDDYNNTCYYENKDGTDRREKFRIRIYDAKSDFIRLELKKKFRDKTQKLSCRLSLEQAKTLIRGEALPIMLDNPPVLNKLCLLMRTKHYKPTVIVEYEREPYVYKLGNVRVTIDKNLSASADFESFFEPKIQNRPIFPFNMAMIEVKFDEFLPDFIKQNIIMNRVVRTAFSKYFLCRYYKGLHLAVSG